MQTPNPRPTGRTETRCPRHAWFLSGSLGLTEGPVPMPDSPEASPLLPPPRRACARARDEGPGWRAPGLFSCPGEAHRADRTAHRSLTTERFQRVGGPSDRLDRPPVLERLSAEPFH